MTTIGVTGGSRFIGSYIVKELVSRGFDVLILDHKSKRPKTSQPNVEYFLGDVRDATAITEFAAHVDGIIHLAAVLGTQETIQNPRPSAETNIIGGLNVFEAASQYNLPVVYAGVGNHWMRSEGAGAYTITKTAIEDFSRMFNKFRGGRISVVRPVNAYGPGQSIAEPYGSSKVRKIMPSFVCRALVGDDIELYGGGVQISDCVFVSDVAWTFVAALEHLMDGGKPDTYEVGPTASVTVSEIADMVLAEAQKWTNSDSRIVSLPMRPGEVPGATVSADVSKLVQLGIQPDADFLQLEGGIELTVKWYAENWLPTYKKDSE